MIAVTTTYFAFGRDFKESIALRLILARLLPYGSKNSAPIPIWAAISVSGLAVALRAISRSDGKPIIPLSIVLYFYFDATLYSTDTR
ncbi:unannotated protein [freshwater metagenome]|uniref:Unannotated protein n=1 Tax=freshwater metagenome TaxID=449393 RepID=A0A6J7UMM9_9ZZZZ